jgi:hypothetical protein
MSAVGNLYDDVCEKLHALADQLVAEEHKLGARLKALVGQLAGDGPALEAEVKSDAAHVVKTAETQGVVPAEHEAEADAVKLGVEAVHDVETAAKDAVTPAHSTAQTAAVIAGEAAVASTEHHA